MSQSIDTAVYTTVHDAEMPVKKIAQHLGMSHQVLINKCGLHSEHHKLSLKESVALQIITGDRSIHRAMGVELDESLGETAAPDVRKRGLGRSVLDACREHADVVRRIHDAMDDGVMTSREAEMCQREIDDEIIALRRLSLSIAEAARRGCA